MTQSPAINATAPAIFHDAVNTDHAAACVAGYDGGATREPGSLPAEALMSIGEVAREFGMTLRALRFYELKRLISPRRHGAVRLYGRADCERVALILTGRKLGFTLAEIKNLIGGQGGEGLRLTREKCVEQIAMLERQKRGMEIAIAELRQIYTSFYKSFLAGADTHPC